MVVVTEDGDGCHERKGEGCGKSSATRSYRNTHGVSKTGHTGSGMVWEFGNHGYTVPITAVSQCHVVTLRWSSKLHQMSSCPSFSSSSALPQTSGKKLVHIYKLTI